jgi:hypothetical protein
VIKPLTKLEFVDIATNGIKVNLYENNTLDYINSLISFIDEVILEDYYIDNYDEKECTIFKMGDEIVKISFEKEKLVFYLNNIEFKTEKEKIAAGHAIKFVYMHSIAWEAINNDGKINQPLKPWPI